MACDADELSDLNVCRMLRLTVIWLEFHRCEA